MNTNKSKKCSYISFSKFDFNTITPVYKTNFQLLTNTQDHLMILVDVQTQMVQIFLQLKEIEKLYISFSSKPKL